MHWPKRSPDGASEQNETCTSIMWTSITCSTSKVILDLSLASLAGTTAYCKSVAVMHKRHDDSKNRQYHFTFWPLVQTMYPITLAPLEVPVGVRRGGFQRICKTPGVCPIWTCTSWGGKGGPETKKSFVSLWHCIIIQANPCRSAVVFVGGLWHAFSFQKHVHACAWKYDACVMGM